MGNRLKLVKMKGDPYQMGLQYGKACSEEIKGFLKNLYGLIHRQFSLTMEEALKRIEPYHALGEKYASHLMEEVRGMGKGAGITFEEAFFLNARRELTYEQESDHCTSYAVSKELSSDHQLIMGQHVDMVPENEELGVMLHVLPERGPEILTWTIAGAIGQTGINSKGFVRCGNGLFSKRIKRGLPAHCCLPPGKTREGEIVRLQGEPLQKLLRSLPVLGRPESIQSRLVKSFLQDFS